MYSFSVMTINEEKQIYLLNKKYLGDYGCEGINMIVKCKIFVNLT